MLMSMVKADLRSRWHKGVICILIFCWVYLLFLVLMPFLPVSALSYMQGTPPCRPNDGFEFNPEQTRYNPFVMQDFFKVTIGFGTLSFTQAKAIDLVWDLMVGRVGQALLATALWKAFSSHIRNAMRRGPITYDTYWAAFMDDQPSAWQTLIFIRDSVTKHSSQPLGATIFVVLAILLVLSFPTMASAMTGYRAKTEGFITDVQGNLVPISSFILAAYVIHDGSRLNLSNNYVFPFAGQDTPLTDYDTLRRNFGKIQNASVCWPSDLDAINAGCPKLRTISAYVEKYGFLALNSTGHLNDIDTDWGLNASETITLPPPALNISAFYMSPAAPFFGRTWVNPRTKTRPFASESAAHTMIRGTTNTTYSLDYMQQHGSCQPQETYEWGFSFVQVFVDVVLLMVWSLGTLFIWLKSHLSLTREKTSLVPSRYQAALGLASCLAGDISTGEKRPSVRELNRYVAADLNGGRLTFWSKEPVAGFQLWKELVGWARNNVWLSVGVLVLVVATATLWITCPISVYIALLVLDGGVIFAGVVGTTPKTQRFLAVAGAISAAVVGVLLLSQGDTWIVWGELRRRDLLRRYG